jgi:hypothetical protein
MDILYNPASDPPRLIRGQVAHGTRTQSPASNYYDSADWWQLRSAILKALQDFPEARDSVIRALRDLHALQDPDAPLS